MHATAPAAASDLAPIIDRFRRDAFAVLSAGIGPRELAALRANAAELILRGRPPDARHPADWFIDPGPGGAPELHRGQFIFDKQPIDDAFLALLGHPRLLALVRALLGERVLCTGEALVFKLPGNGR